MSVRRTGDWAQARRLLSGAPARLRAATTLALRQSAHELRNEIVQGLTRQAPGGQPLEPLSPLTLAARELERFTGTKALIARGDLRNAIGVILRGDEAFIGIARSARSRDGKSLVDVAEVHEFGSAPVVIPMTPAMRRYLAVLLRKAGLPRTGGTGRGVVVVKIPARPFLRPAFDKFRQGAGRRFLARVEKLVMSGGNS